MSNAVTEAAAELGYLVLSCRPSEVEAGFSFVGLADLLGEVVGDAPLARRRCARHGTPRVRCRGGDVTEGTAVRHIRTAFVPDDETCFHFFEATSEAAVVQACERAGIGAIRIVPVVE